MGHLAILSVTGKLFVIVSTFLLVRAPDDYLYVPLLQSAGMILVGFAGLVLALRSFPIRFRPPSPGILKREFLHGWHLFVSRVATTLYTTSNVVILGLLADTVFVAYYAAGEKIVRAATDGLQLPLSQAIYPHISRLALQSKRAALRFAGRAVGLLSVATLTISAGLFLGAPYIAWAVLGEGAQGGAAVMRILAPLPFVIGLNAMFGVQIMTNFGLKRLLARILIAAGILNVVVAVLLAGPLKHAGAAIASLTTEVFVMLALFVSLRRHGLDIVRSAAGGRCDG